MFRTDTPLPPGPTRRRFLVWAAAAVAAVLGGGALWRGRPVRHGWLLRQDDV